MSRRVRAVVPASTSNLGPGFDLFGLALDRYLRVTVSIEGEFVVPGTARPTWQVSWHGEGNGEPGAVPLGEENLVVTGIQHAWREAGVTVDGKVEIEAESEIPVARGLGSSGAALVAGLLAGDALAEMGMGSDSILALGAAEEGHPDNVAASLYGGLVAAAPVGPTGKILVHRGRLHEDLLLAVITPAFTISTRMAREALPGQVAHREAVRSQQRAFFLFHALSEGYTEHLRALVEDVLHQPARAPLIPAYAEVVSAAYEEGAAAVWLSGSGPALVVVSEEGVDALEKIGAAVVRRWESEQIPAVCMVLGPDDLGAGVHEVPPLP